MGFWHTIDVRTGRSNSRKTKLMNSYIKLRQQWIQLIMILIEGINWMVRELTHWGGIYMEFVTSLRRRPKSVVNIAKNQTMGVVGSHREVGHVARNMGLGLIHEVAMREPTYTSYAPDWVAVNKNCFGPIPCSKSVVRESGGDIRIESLLDGRSRMWKF